MCETLVSNTGFNIESIMLVSQRKVSSFEDWQLCNRKLQTSLFTFQIHLVYNHESTPSQGRKASVSCRVEVKQSGCSLFVAALIIFETVSHLDAVVLNVSTMG